MKHITIGTAGHIDHGKTALVKRLTGTDTDRLAEEQDRGMTIELGFAFLQLASGNQVSIVDVPGHEKFVKTMVAGVTGIDIVLLIIAADEGIMPQTIEHLDILSVLGLSKGVVALTKSDLVDQKTLDQRIREIRKYLKDTPLESLPVIPVSSKTGAGIDDLLIKIDELAIQTREKSPTSLFRLPVDRVFTMTGHGTIVTGTISGGTVTKGDPVQILPEGLTTKVRNIQVRNQSVDQAYGGDRCALNLASIEKKDLQRGSVVLESGNFRTTSLLDARVQMVPGSNGLVHNQRVHFHTGTTAVLARVRLLGADKIDAGEKGYVQLRLEEPVAAFRADRFILRSFSPVHTIGGGRLLLHHTRNRKRFDSTSMKELAFLDLGTDKEVIQWLIQSSSSLMDVESIYLETLIDRDRIKEMLEELVVEGVIYAMGSTGKYYSLAWCDEMLKELEGVFHRFYNKNPYRYQISKEALRKKEFPFLSNKDFDGMLEIMSAMSSLRLEEKFVHLHKEKRLDEISDLVEVARTRQLFETPDLPTLSPAQVAEETSLPIAVAEEILHFFISIGYLVELEKGVFCSRRSLEMIYQTVVDAIQKEKSITVARLRDLLGTGRKTAIYFLEYFDAVRVTKRDGNDRIPGPRFRDFLH
ncbi:selenocysteine-specific translation elongation factor [Alkalibacter rhizosphaerae]|uniref:Selenocysteine-specific elongation factor n=1 Tax=Alkalibacter rhizosphaerae TaxID=2815577 RepID=A0A974XEB8_9FIRM|nr:selenocysteine-specific translation elongation factor [Alkalibacter rhizosphaerae]QSX08263.1 selenocysteine-specific translation elongation factor [Alkalibacter rhizosphaerae]